MADKQLIAITVIHRTIEPGKAGDKSKGIKAVKPKIQVIQPGTAFLASSDKKDGEEKSEFDFFKDSGAAREPNKDEKVEVADEGEGTGTVKTKTDDLDKKSVADLKKIADEKNLTYAANASKADLVALIRGSGDDLV